VDEAIIREQNREIQELESEIGYLSEIFATSGELVQGQGERLKELERALEEARVSVAIGSENIIMVNERPQPLAVVMDPKEQPKFFTETVKENLVAIGAGTGTSVLALGITKGAFVLAAVTTLPATIVPIAACATAGIATFGGVKFYQWARKPENKGAIPLLTLR